MTGLDLLKQNMIERGCTKQQCESKVVPIILDIIASADDTDKAVYMDLDSAQRATETLRQDYQKIERNIRGAKEAYERFRIKRDEEINEKIQYIRSFLLSLSFLETAEAKDRLKTAQLFINNVNVNTKYDNTAFINGLAAILTGTSVGELKQFQKVDAKLPIPTYGIDAVI